MSAKVLVDTNVLVYLYDPFEPNKRRQANAVVDALVRVNGGAISTQVLVEFVSVVTRKLKVPLSPASAYSQVEALIQAWQVIEITPSTVLDAVRGMRDYGFSIWDAQIWATARMNGISLVLSEDFHSSASIEGVRFQNPFVPGFDLEEIISA